MSSEHTTPDSTEYAIEVNGLSKCYQIYDKPSDRLKQMLMRGRKQYYKEFWALKDVSFKIKKGGPRKTIPGAFLINEGKTVMIRVPGTTMGSRSKYAGTKHAQQIKALQTIDVPQMFNTKRINAKVLRFIEDKFPAIFANEARFYTERFKAGK